VNLLLDRAAGTRPIPGNQIRLLQDGPETYAAMLDLIGQATRWIHFENYIIRGDRTGQRFAEALGARAREGLKVRVLYDRFGSMGTPGRYWGGLRQAGVEVRGFNRFRLISFFSNLERDHRKLALADGTRAVVGGLCIGDEWMGDSARGIPPWRDTAVEIAGPAVALLDQAFLRIWQRSGAPVGALPEMPEVPALGDAAVWVLAGEPGRLRTSRVLELIATGTQERLWLTDAYLVPPRRLRQAIADAARNGVDVRLLAPASSDLPWIRNLTRIGYRYLLKAGARIYEWDGPMLHAKSSVSDGRWVRVGSSNLNPSSLIGNYELDVLIEQPELALAAEAQFRRDISQSHEVLLQPMRGANTLRSPLGQMIPPRLHREEPELPMPPHRKSGGETRRRAAVSLRRVASGAIRSVYGPLSLLLVGIGALFLLLPRVMAIIFGALCAWLAAAAGLEARRRHRET
jgi:cardiolipin synthase